MREFERDEDCIERSAHEHLRLMLDTNVVIDFLNEREPFYQDARLLMMCIKLGEFDAYLTGSQFTDLIYVLSDGGRKGLLEEALRQLRGLRTFIDVCTIDGNNIDQMLDTTWEDPEDYLIYDAAKSLNASAIITRDQKGFEHSDIKTLDCNRFFKWIQEEYEIDYEEMKDF